MNGHELVNRIGLVWGAPVRTQSHNTWRTYTWSCIAKDCYASGSYLLRYPTRVRSVECCDIAPIVYSRLRRLESLSICRCQSKAGFHFLSTYFFKILYDGLAGNRTRGYHSQIVVLNPVELTFGDKEWVVGMGLSFCCNTCERLIITTIVIRSSKLKAVALVLELKELFCGSLKKLEP